jgi:DNA-binding NtrC family response regulator
VFSVDRLSSPAQSAPSASDRRELVRIPAHQERELIEAALAESHGRVSGPSGAAAKLGIPSTTLESKIKALKIDKHRFELQDLASREAAELRLLNDLGDLVTRPATAVV